MLYSQQQALSILGIDQSTFVYWMRAVPRIQRLKGRGCRFSRSDLLALGAISTLTGQLGMGIGWLQPFVEQIFDAVEDESSPSEKAIVVEATGAKLEKIPVAITDQGARAIVPLAPIIEAIRAAERAPELLPLERLMLGARAPLMLRPRKAG